MNEEEDESSFLKGLTNHETRRKTAIQKAQIAQVCEQTRETKLMMKHVQQGDLSSLAYSSQLDILVMGMKTGLVVCFKLEVESDPQKLAEIKEEGKLGFNFGGQKLVESRKFYQKDLQELQDFEESDSEEEKEKEKLKKKKGKDKNKGEEKDEEKFSKRDLKWFKCFKYYEKQVHKDKITAMQVDESRGFLYTSSKDKKLCVVDLIHKDLTAFIKI